MVCKTKFSIAFIGETRKSKVILRYFLCISSTCNLAKSRVPENRQTENLGGFLRISALRNADFSNSPFCRNRDKSLQFNLKHRHKKAEWRVTIRHQDKKMVADFYNRKTANVKSAILKSSIKLVSDIALFTIFSRRFRATVSKQYQQIQIPYV